MQHSNPTQNEIWKDIPGFVGLYEVSNLGTVRSKNRTVRHNCGGDKTVRSQIISQLITPNGYCQVSLWREGKRKVFSVHRLVLLAFVGKCPTGYEVRHLNSIKTDNRLVNLAYGTHSENVIDTINLGRNSRQKLNPELVLKIRKRANNGETIKALAAEYRVSERAISKIKNHHTYAWL
jgi:hypothetical protein